MTDYTKNFNVFNEKDYRKCPKCGTESRKTILVETMESFYCETCGTSWYFTMKNTVLSEDGLTTQVELFVRDPDKVKA